MSLTKSDGERLRAVGMRCVMISVFWVELKPACTCHKVGDLLLCCFGEG